MSFVAVRSSAWGAVQGRDISAGALPWARCRRQTLCWAQPTELCHSDMNLEVLLGKRRTGSPEILLATGLTDKCSFFYISLACSKLFWNLSFRWADDLHALCCKIYGVQLRSIIYYHSALIVPVLLEDNGSDFNFKCLKFHLYWILVNKIQTPCTSGESEWCVSTDFSFPLIRHITKHNYLQFTLPAAIWIHFAQFILSRRKKPV